MALKKLSLYLVKNVILNGKMIEGRDSDTAAAFATSWNNLPGGSVYNNEQFEDWIAPIGESQVKDKSVLELGCGNGSLMVHMSRWEPSKLIGVELGESVDSCRENMFNTGFQNYEIIRGDLVEYSSEGYDIVYSIGVLHHLKLPRSGFDSVVANTKSGGLFHCWVYAKEGNGIVIAAVEPIRRLASKFPWWITKYLIATPLAVPFYLYGKTIKSIPFFKRFRSSLPLYDYMQWIGMREFGFFRHVAFDQLVTPQTTFLSKGEVEQWLSSHSDISQNSVYCIFRNGNSWKFGGRKT